MKKIPLSQGQFALIDDEDFSIVSQHKWYAYKNRYTFYVRTNVLNKGIRGTLLLHRLLLNAKNVEQIDHKDRNGLNNQRNNIRICSASENMINRIFKNSTGFRGVFKIKKTGRFTGAIQVDKKRVTVGCYATAKEAALAYNNMARKIHGDCAILNSLEV